MAVLLPKISLQASKTFTLDTTASSSDESLLLYNTNTDNSTSTGLAVKGFYYWGEYVHRCHHCHQQWHSSWQGQYRPR